MSNRIAVFHHGVVQQLSTPNELYERPRNAFVARFIGENNRLTGMIEEVSGETGRVRLASGEIVGARRATARGAGDRTLLSLRPERLTVSPEAGRYANVPDGRSEELIYLGDHIRARLAVAGRTDFIVKMPNRSDAATLSRGDAVKIGWAIEDCHALDVE